VQDQADDFVFGCGVLALAERYEGWLREGVLTGQLRRHAVPDHQRMMDVLVLRSAQDSFFDEDIGRAGIQWASAQIRANDSAKERRLEQRHRKLARRLAGQVELIDGWLMSYTSTREIDDYFLEWARLYLRRIFSQDMIGPDDIIGGRPFSRYVDVLTALSARAQKHLAFAAILRARHPTVHIRNLLTTYCDRTAFMDSLAQYMDADRSEVEAILASLTLNGDNLEIHTHGGDAAWAPIVQASTNTLLLPTYGLEINPFLFLLTDLRSRHEREWFSVANNRERRWVQEIERLFVGSRWQTHANNLRLREAGKDLTDIDFAAFDRKTNELALFQLKWQQPVGMDNRSRRSTGKNLLVESNRWVEAVLAWLDRKGVADLNRRLGFDGSPSTAVNLFVLGRYHVHLTGFEARDVRAIWSDWAHFRRVRSEKPRSSISQTAFALRQILSRSRAKKKGESMMFPIGDITVLLNPTSEPNETNSKR
jgi:hypothetical protein